MSTLPSGRRSTDTARGPRATPPRRSCCLQAPTTARRRGRARSSAWLTCLPATPWSCVGTWARSTPSESGLLRASGRGRSPWCWVGEHGACCGTAASLPTQHRARCGAGSWSAWLMATRTCARRLCACSGSSASPTWRAARCAPSCP